MSACRYGLCVFRHLRLSLMALAVTAAAACGGSAGPVDRGGAQPTSGGAYFTYTFEDKVFRIDARAGATPEDVSARLARFGAGTRDRWLVPSSNGATLVLSTDRLACPNVGECLAITPRDLSTLTAVLPGGEEVSVEGTPAVSDDGNTVVFPARGGPHSVDLWTTRRSGAGWAAAVLLTAASTAAYNNSPALAFDGARVLFDCGSTPYPEGGDTNACEVRTDGTGLRVLVRPTTLPNPRENFVQFPHDSLDGVLFQGSWAIGAERPETIWLLPAAGGAPRDLGRLLTNAVSPCGLRDGRIGVLWLSRPGNPMGKHELTLLGRDGTVERVLTPDVDVSDIGIGCGG